MHSLLTGGTFDHGTKDQIVEEPWTAEAYRTAARRNLAQASKHLSSSRPGGAETAAVLVAAARALAGLANSAPASPDEDPKTASPTSRVKFNPGRDHDSL